MNFREYYTAGDFRQLADVSDYWRITVFANATINN
jgi:hypothetical protein